MIRRQLRREPTISAVFDFDGTLVDSREGMREIVDVLTEEYDLPHLTADELLQLRDIPLIERFKRLNIPRRKVPGMVRRALHLFREKAAEFPLYEGIIDMLGELRSCNVELHILSSNRIDTIQDCLRRNAIDSFSSVQSSGGIFGKPRHLNRLIRKRSLTRENSWYIGDELRDIAAARRAGIRSIAVTWGYDSELLIESGYPTHVVHRPEQIPRLLTHHAPAESPDGHFADSSHRKSGLESSRQLR